MKIKKILVSQPQPVDYEKSPYHEIGKKYGLEFTFRKLFRIEGLVAQEFRRQRVNLVDYTAVIFTCRNAVDNFFRLCGELRMKMPDTTKYFCISESTAYYLQKYVQFRKRKIFHGNENSAELMSIIKKNSTEKYLLPCTENVKHEIMQMLISNKINFTKAIIYKTIAADIKDVDLKKFQMLVLFSPFGVESLYANFPKFKQGDLMIGVFGINTALAAKEKGLTLSIEAPTEKAPSMTMALAQYFEKINKKQAIK